MIHHQKITTRNRRRKEKTFQKIEKNKYKNKLKNQINLVKIPKQMVKLPKLKKK